MDEPRWVWAGRVLVVALGVTAVADLATWWQYRQAKRGAS